MVERLMRAHSLAQATSAAPLSRVVVLAVALTAALGARAQALPDPTRPSILPTPASAPGSPAPEGETAWVLQSVRLGAGRARAAVISGQLVQIGARFGSGRLVRVTERSAVIEGPQGLTTLWLIDDVEKQDATPVVPPGESARSSVRSSKPAAPALPQPAAPLAASSRIDEVQP